MRLYSYIVRFDGGFAPCVTSALCTLACCKPRIRATAQYGDWVLGTTPKKRGSGRMVYMMQVQRAFTFREYQDQRGLGRRKDNIYQPRPEGGYSQRKNKWHGPSAVRKDLSTDRVLASTTFVYFGRTAPKIPLGFRNLIAKGQGHRVFGNAAGELADHSLQKQVKNLVRWAFRRGRGVEGKPFGSPCAHKNCH